MNVLVVGSGGREHALAWALARSPRKPRLFALPGSDAMTSVAARVPGDALDAAAVLRACRESSIDLVVVGPEAPLAAGLSDALRAAGVPCFGPAQDGARLESSKSFAKEFMRRHGVPTAPGEAFDDPSAAAAAARRLGAPLVVKADGLAAGKGVRVCGSLREALEALREFMEERRLGEAGTRVLLERRLEGSELTVMTLWGGGGFRVLPTCRDHKRLLDGDAGPNTGGMGAFAPVPLGPEILERVRAQVLEPVRRGLEREGIDYRGVLYCGLMLTAEGPRVLEFNARFGDPEAQTVLPLLSSDLLESVLAVAEGKLPPELAARPGFSVCVNLASEGYPGTPRVGRPISGLEAAASEPGVLLFHSGTRRGPSGWQTAGGRVLSVVGVGPSLEQARARAYAAAGRISFEGMHYRKDIAGAGASLAARGSR